MPDLDKLATDIMSKILDDVTDRRGWRQEWDRFDNEIKAEIKAEWYKLILDTLKKHQE